MKRFALSLAAAVLSIGILAGCGGSQTPATNATPTAPEAAGGEAAAPELVTLKVGAMPSPHGDILRFIQPAAEKAGLKIEVVEFTDYVKPNTALWEKDLDANYFQHVPYMNDFAKQHNMELVAVGPVHIEPLGLYSLKVQKLEDLPAGATITIPNDATNSGRALALLAQHGLITLKDGVGVSGTVKDIVDNPKQIKFEELDAEVLPRTLQDADAAIINGNYYLEAKQNLGVDAAILAQESGKDNPYANMLVVRKGDETRPEIQTLMKLLQSPEVKQFIEEQFGGTVVPAF